MMPIAAGAQERAGGSLKHKTERENDRWRLSMHSFWWD